MISFCGDLAREVVRGICDFALPPECLLCAEEAIAAPPREPPSSAPTLPGLCLRCLQSVYWLSPRMPKCKRCGRPYPVRFHGDRCAECTKNPPAFSAAASAFAYRGAGRRLLLAYKFRRDETAPPLLIQCLQFGAASLPGKFTVVASVPSHRRREEVRGFSPVRELARELAELLNLPFRGDWIVRIRDDAPQGKSPGRSRRSNVASAFAPSGRRAWFSPRSPRHERILLIDDVFTTGATARECARELRRAGARDVQVATLARGGIIDAPGLSSLTKNSSLTKSC